MSSNPRPPQVKNSAGQIVRLSGLVGRGGEGAVYGIADRPELVAKIYPTPDQDRAEKLQVMVRMRNERLSGVTAGPVETLHRVPDSEIVGFVMPRISDYYDIHMLYSPKTRLNTFPDVGWSFLVRAAGNVARVFRVIHENNLIVGDVNHGNLLVNRRAMTCLIDCDSFQIIANGKVLPCKVGVDTHTPPELQGRTLAGVVRSVNHDAFGLAIMLFQILFLGRHPYAGTFLGKGDMPIGKAIAEGRFAYGTGAASAMMQAPPFTLSLTAVPAEVATLFELAFSPGSQGIGPKRPMAGEWVTALEGLEKNLKTCSTNPAHQYPRTSIGCPWCRIEAGARIQIFNPVPIATSQISRDFDLTAVWAKIEAAVSPGPIPQLHSGLSISVPASRAAVQEGMERRRRTRWSYALTGVGTLLFLVVVGAGVNLGVAVAIAGAFVASGYFLRRTSPCTVQRDAQLRLSAAQAESDQLRHLLEAEASERAFQTKKGDLYRLRDEYRGLDARRQQMIQELTTQAEQFQRRQFLERHRIWNARIAGIGNERTLTLQSYGIETAADVTASAVAMVPGFGPVRTAALVNWRNDVERRFKFNPRLGTDPAQLRSVDNRIMADRNRLESELTAGPSHLDQIREHTLARRSELIALLSQASTRIAQAQADLSADRSSSVL